MEDKKFFRDARVYATAAYQLDSLTDPAAIRAVLLKNFIRGLLYVEVYDENGNVTEFSEWEPRTRKKRKDLATKLGRERSRLRQLVTCSSDERAIEVANYRKEQEQAREKELQKIATLRTLHAAIGGPLVSWHTRFLPELDQYRSTSVNETLADIRNEIESSSTLAAAREKHLTRDDGWLFASMVDDRRESISTLERKISELDTTLMYFEAIVAHFPEIHLDPTPSDPTE